MEDDEVEDVDDGYEQIWGHAGSGAHALLGAVHLACLTGVKSMSWTFCCRASRLLVNRKKTIVSMPFVYNSRGHLR